MIYIDIEDRGYFFIFFCKKGNFLFLFTFRLKIIPSFFILFIVSGTTLNSQKTTINKKPIQQVSSSAARSVSPLSSQKKKEEDKLFEFLNSNPPALPTTVSNKGYCHLL